MQNPYAASGKAVNPFSSVAQFSFILGTLISSYSFSFNRLGRKDPGLGSPIHREITNQTIPSLGGRQEELTVSVTVLHFNEYTVECFSTSPSWGLNSASGWEKSGEGNRCEWDWGYSWDQEEQVRSIQKELTPDLGLSQKSKSSYHPGVNTVSKHHACGTHLQRGVILLPKCHAGCIGP